MGATINMTLMYQMERIDKSMDDWDRQMRRRGRRSVSVTGSNKQRRRQRRPGRGWPLKASRTMEAKPGGDTAAAAAAIVRIVRAAAVKLTMEVGGGGRPTKQ
jgi:hypothetical protein